MAKKKTATASKSKGKAKVIVGLVVLLLVGIFIVCAVGSSGFANANVKTWFNSWGKGEEKPNFPTEKAKASSFQLTPNDGKNSIMLLSAELIDEPVAQVEDSYTLTATINPYYADIQTVTGAIDFVNANSEWASGKNVSDYVELTQKADGMSFTVTCKAPFGERIRIRVSSTDNEEAYADCFCDYVKRVKNIVFSDLLSLPESGFTYSFECTDYTLDSSIALSIETKMTLTKSFQNTINAKLDAVGLAGYGVIANNGYVYLTVDYSLNKISLRYPSCLTFLIDQSSGDNDGFEEMLEVDGSRAVRLAIAECDDIMANLNITFNSSYNGQVYASFSKTVGLRFDYVSVKVPVSSVGLSDYEFIF